MIHSGSLTAPVEILLVEDNPGDVELTRLALEEGPWAIHLNVVGDGVEALDFLYQNDPYARVSCPDLVILDLNLPRKNGHEVLAQMKTDVTLRRIPVIVLTTSQAQEDIHQAYDNHVNCYIQKPTNFSEFTEVVRAIETFWFKIVRLPTA